MSITETGTEAEQMIRWAELLRQYASGEKSWDTGEDWVCETHPASPFGMGYSFDCRCGGPGMPPIRP